ncbi:MAG: hypothetical protein GX442_20335 [Candidatus Riflebacteria bacterium]|nr:hypothetical protein [Candidatus Riflebacteria bacterium]
MKQRTRGKDNGRGVALLAVLLLLVCIGLVAFYLHSYSRQQRQQTFRLGLAEVAFRAAEFGARQGTRFVRAGVDWLNSSAPETFPKDAKAPPALQPFAAAFIQDDRLIEETAEMRLPLDGSPLAEGLEPYAKDLYLDVRIRIERSSPLLEDPGIPGLPDLARERRGRFVVDVQAGYREVERRVVSVFEFRTVHLQVPVVGRFTLLAGDLAGPLNVIPGKLASGLIPPRFQATTGIQPLVLVNGPPVTPADRPKLAADPGPFLDRQGWVFLGTPPDRDPQSLTLGLAPGDVPAGENFLLHEFRLFVSEIEAGSFAFGREFTPPGSGQSMRLWETHQRYACLTGLYEETKTSARRELMVLEPRNTQKSSLLRLMGTNAAPSPTLVFGKVWRSYLLERGIRRKPVPPADPDGPASATALPYLTAPAFQASPWPGVQAAARDALLAACGNEWLGYREGMCSLVVSPLNEGLAFFFDQSAPAGTGQRAMQPAFQAGSARLNRVLKFTPGSPAGLVLDGPLTLIRDGATVFEGEVQQVLPNLGPLLRRRCGREFATGPELFKHLKDLQQEGKAAAGFYHIKGPFTWTADFNQVALGGVGIVAEGLVRIVAGIAPQPPPAVPDARANRIVLASLDGDLLVETAEPLQAALLAPQGTLRLGGGGGVQVAGLVAVARLDLAGLATTAPKQIRYDPDHDWGDAEAYRRSFRVMLEHQPLVFQTKLR